MARANLKEWTNSPIAPPHDAALTYKVWAEDFEPINNALEDGTAGINTQQLEVGGTMFINSARQIPVATLPFGDGANANQSIEFLTGAANNPKFRWRASDNQLVWIKRGETSERALGGLTDVRDRANFSTLQQAIDDLGLNPGLVFIPSSAATGEPTTVPGGVTLWDLRREALVAGSTAQISQRWERNKTNTRSQIGSIYPVTEPVRVGYSFGDTVISGSSEVQNFCVASVIVNENASTNAVALWGKGNARGAGTAVWGGNVIARNDTGSTNSKLVGLEIDVEPTVGTTVSTDCKGLIINAFNLDIPGSAVLIGGVSGGTFNDGIIVQGIKSTGAILAPGSGQTSVRALIDTGSTIYTDSAIVIANGGLVQGARIRFNVSAGTEHAYIYNDNSNNMRCVMSSGSGGWVFRDKSDTNSLLSIEPGGDIVANKGGGTFKMVSAAGGGSARLYCDVSGGKSRLLVAFPTGVPVLLATEA